MNDNKTKLAVKIIGDQFGDIVQDVAKVLTEGDSCTLQHIVRAVNANITARNTSAALNINNTGLVLKHKTGLAMDFPTVRSALLILHQHNCLVIDKPKGTEFDPVAPTKDMKTGFVYSLNVTNILHRMHFARLLSIVKAKYGELAVQIVETVMMYGKVRLDQIAEQVSNMSTEPVSLNEIRTTFESLVSNRFLVTVYPSPTGSVTSGTGPVMEIVTKKRLIDLDTPSESSKRTKTGAASASASAAAAAAATAAAAPSKRRPASMNMLVKQELDDGIPVELRMLMGGGASSGTSTSASAASETSKAPETGARAGAGGRGGAAGRGGRGSGDSSTAASGGRGGRGAGRGGAGGFKTEETSVDSSLISSTAASKLWTIGWDQFIRETRHNACVQVVTQLHAAMAGSVVRVILQLSMNAESGSNQNKSGEVSVLEMFKQMEREGQLAQFPGSSKEDKMKVLRHLLEILRMSESAAVIKVVGSDNEVGGPSYMVNIDRLIATLQRRTVFTIASERFGFVSARIVELLQRHQYLEQQQVCDMALLPARETRERLYKLFLDKWINYIDLSKRSDFNPSTSFYFWYLDLPLLKSTIRDHVYQTMLNLTLRRAHETEAGRELLDREHLIDNELDRSKYTALVAKLNKLDLALYKVDSTILLMEHF